MCLPKCKPGFVHYSGPGGRVKDKADVTGYSSTLFPVDFDRPGVGQILDKELYKHLVCSMPRGASLTCLFDCCHSGTILDLPYDFVADGEQEEMTANQGFDFAGLLVLVRDALSDAGVERLSDLRDRETWRKVKDALVDNLQDAARGGGEGEEEGAERVARGLARELARGAVIGPAAREARWDRRRERREDRRNW